MTDPRSSRPTSSPAGSAGTDAVLSAAIDLARRAGQSLLDRFGSAQVIANKGDASNVVTQADLHAEALIVDGIRRRFPLDSIIAEETGCDLRSGELTWIVDPLDGTSNHAAGIPWFGVLIGVWRGDAALAGVMALPASGDMYWAQVGQGAHKNGSRIHVSTEARLADVLWAYGMDGGDSDDEAQRNVQLLGRLLRRVRNVRATNCLIDAAQTAEGRFGGMLNQSTRLWDIAAPSLIVQEAGGHYTDLLGQPLRLDLGAGAGDRVYAVLAGAPALHRQVVSMIQNTPA